MDVFYDDYLKYEFESWKRKSIHHFFGIISGNIMRLISFFFLVDPNTFGANWFSFHCIKRLPLHRQLAVLISRQCIEWQKYLHIFATIFIYGMHISNTSSKYMDYTYSADEAIRMPLTVQSRNIIFHNGTVATATLGGKHIEVIITAIGFAISLVEAFLPELLTALCAEEVFHVPCFLQGGNAFLKK